MSDRQNSLRPIVDRTPYRPFFRPLRGAGNYPWSVVSARLIQTDRGGEFLDADVYPSFGAVKLLIFCQDVPVLLRVLSSYPSSRYDGGQPIPPTDFPEPGVALVSGFFSGGMVSEGSTPGESGKVGRVVVQPSGLVVPGYTAQFTLVERLLGLPTAPQEELPAAVQVGVITESGVLAGEPTFGAPTGGTSPAFIEYTSYTQAVRDARNLIVDPVTGIRYVVVGLYELA